MCENGESKTCVPGVFRQLRRREPGEWREQSTPSGKLQTEGVEIIFLSSDSWLAPQHRYLQPIIHGRRSRVHPGIPNS